MPLIILYFHKFSLNLRTLYWMQRGGEGFTDPSHELLSFIREFICSVLWLESSLWFIIIIKLPHICTWCGCSDRKNVSIFIWSVKNIMEHFRAFFLIIFFIFIIYVPDNVRKIHQEKIDIRRRKIHWHTTHHTRTHSHAYLINTFTFPLAPNKIAKKLKQKAFISIWYRLSLIKPQYKKTFRFIHK